MSRRPPVLSDEKPRVYWVRHRGRDGRSTYVAFDAYSPGEASVRATAAGLDVLSVTQATPGLEDTIERWKV